MKNLRNRFAVDLVTSEEKLKKLAAQPPFKQFKISHENLVAVERAKVELTLNRPIFAGFAILDLSKTLMYDFLTNRDCLTYRIQTDSVYEDFYANKHLFNFSGYENKTPFYNDENKKIIGKMKDELNGETIEEFAGLRAKMYSLKA